MSVFHTHRNWIVAVLAGVLLVGAAVGMAQRESGDSAVVRGAADARELSSAFRHITKQALPSVVSIETIGKPVELTHSPMFDENSPFREFFKNDPRLREFFEQMPKRQPRSHGMGSGFIIDPSGIILTNNHVVRNAERVKVKLQDGREFVATEVKTDPRSDVATVRIEADEPLPALPLGDSDRTEIGDWVLAVGSPFGLQGTVTAGIISAKGRGPGIAHREDFLQTDAAINPGNSGGPLLNLNGEAIGINTAISTRSGGYDGIGFAIPINMAKWVANQLIDNGQVKRAFLGVTIQPVDGKLAEQFGVEVGQGAIVSQVLPDSPANDAGLKPGDIILQFNGQDVTGPRNLQGIVEKMTIGKAYEMTIVRNGKRQTIDVTVREMPKDFAVAETPNDLGRSPKDESFKELGIEIQEVTPELAEQLGYTGTGGVVVTSVDADSPAYEAGIRTGAIIKQVGQREVNSPEQFRQAIKAESLEKGILLLVRDPRGGTGFVVVQSQ